MAETPPYAKLRAAVNGGAPQSGGIVLAGGESIQLSSESTAAWSSARWEIFSYPSGYATPSGWTLDTDTGIIYYEGVAAPPAFTVDAAATRAGKYMLRLLVNGMTSNESDPGFVPKLCDESTALCVPFSNGMQSVGYREKDQFDSNRGWQGELQRSLEALDAGGGGGGGGGPTLGGSNGQLAYRVDATNIGTVAGASTDGTNLTVKDANLIIADDADATKKAKFQASGITASTTRTFTLPNVDATLDIQNGVTTPEQKQAVGNGVAADQTAFTSLLTDLGTSSYGLVRLGSRKTYLVTGGFDPAAGSGFIGAGYCTVITTASNAAIFNGTGADDLLFAHFALDGNTTGASQAGFYFNPGPSRSRFFGVTVQQMGTYGFLFGPTDAYQGVQVIAGQARNIGDSAYHVLTEYSSFIGCFADNAGRGLTLAAGNVAWVGCHVAGSTVGLDVIAGGNDAHGLVVASDFNHCGTASVRVNGAIANAMSIRSCNIYDGAILITNNTAIVSFNDCEIDFRAITNTDGKIRFNDCVFASAYATGGNQSTATTESGTGWTQFTNCTLKDGTIPAFIGTRVHRTYTPAADTDLTLSWQDSVAERILVQTGSWTSGHQLTSRWNAEIGRKVWVHNETAFTIKYKWAAGTAVSIPPGHTGLVGGDGTNAKLLGLYSTSRVAFGTKVDAAGSNKDDYDATDSNGNPVETIVCQANVNWRGIANGWAGRRIRLVSDGAILLEISHEDSNSAAANRIITETGLTRASHLKNRNAFLLEYDASVSRWRVVNESIIYLGGDTTTPSIYGVLPSANIATVLSTKTLVDPQISGTVTATLGQGQIQTKYGQGQTATTTPLALASYTMSNETCVTFDFVAVMARRTSVTKGGRWKGSVTYRRTGGGAPTIVGSPDYATPHETTAADDVAFNVNGNAIEVRATAADTDGRNWVCELHIAEANAV